MKKLIKLMLNDFKNFIFEFLNKKGISFKFEKKNVVFIPIDNIINSRFYVENAFFNNKEVHVNLPLNKARSLSGKKFNIKNHHSVEAINKFLHSDKSLNIFQFLYEYYCNKIILKNIELNSLNDVFELNSEKLASIPSWVVLYPWSNYNTNDLSILIKAFDYSTFVENRRRGIAVNGSNGGSQFVFTSKQRARLESKLISNLFISFTTKGFDVEKNSKDPIGAILLVDGNNYSWMISAGIHRTCVLNALGYDNVTVKLKGIIYREDCEYWPNVQNKLFNPEEALNIFDKIISN